MMPPSYDDVALVPPSRMQLMKSLANRIVSASTTVAIPSTSVPMFGETAASPLLYGCWMSSFPANGNIPSLVMEP